MGPNDIHSLAHSKWNCKYHIVFAPKYRRRVLYGSKKVEIPPKMAVSHFMRYLKGKSSTMIYERFGDFKYKYRNRSFWCKGYYVDTVGKNEHRIAEYIKQQLEEDELGDQVSIPEVDHFRRKKVSEADADARLLMCCMRARGIRALPA